MENIMISLKPQLSKCTNERIVLATAKEDGFPKLILTISSTRLREYDIKLIAVDRELNMVRNSVVFLNDIKKDELDDFVKSTANIPDNEHLDFVGMFQ